MKFTFTGEGGYFSPKSEKDLFGLLDLKNPRRLVFHEMLDGSFMVSDTNKIVGRSDTNQFPDTETEPVEPTEKQIDDAWNDWYKQNYSNATSDAWEAAIDWYKQFKQ